MYSDSSDPNSSILWNYWKSRRRQICRSNLTSESLHCYNTINHKNLVFLLRKGEDNIAN
jgi:hypothetical protein